MFTINRFSILILLSSVLCLLAPGAGEGAVFFIGIDGADSVLVADLVKAKRMPHLAALIENGVQGELDTLSPLPLNSPVMWTSMATGKGYKKHGISDFFKPNKRELFLGADRKVPALWNMVSSRQKTVGVVGYLMTYPVEAVNGVMVSDNYFSLLGPQRVVYPGGRTLKLSRTYNFEKDDTIITAAQIAGIPLNYDFIFMPSLNTYDSQDFQEHYIFDQFVGYMQRDTGFARLDEELLEKDKFDLFITYFLGVDFVSHLVWGRYEAAKSGAKVVFGGLIPAYYAYMDELIGRVLAKAGKEDTVIVVSDHGFKLRAVAGPLTVLSGCHRPGGIFVAKGPGIKSGIRLKKPLMDWDIAPTVLYLMGLPAARDMDGKIAEEMFKEDYLAAHPASYMDRYPMPARDADAWQTLPFTLQEFDRLRRSGYLE